MISISGLLCVVAISGAKADPKPWMNRNLTPNARAKLLLPELSVQEKIAMTWATHTSENTAKQFNATGVGAVKFMSAFSCGNNMEKCVAERNDLQQLFINSSAHGIPISFINEGLHGGAAGGTIFPEPIGQSMTWNRTLVTAITSAIAKTASAIGVDMVFAPVVNMMPDPRFGRLQEGFGENPTIASELGAAAVTGLQGYRNGPESYRLPNKVGSLGKHYAAYGAAIGGLNGGPADVSNRTLHEIYLRPWMALAREGVRAVMPAHQTVHDIPAHGNGWLIDTTLRETFGFGNGIALSDCNDVGALYDSRFAATRSEAAAKALAAGVDWDLQCGGDASQWGYGNGYLQDALDNGLVDESVLDTVVLRVLQQKFASNLFDSPYVPVDGVNALLDSAAHRQLALEAAEQSAVLLKNTNNALPLTLRGKNVAVSGGLATGGDAEGAMEGSYTLGGAHVVSVAEAIQNTSVVGAASVTVLNNCNPQGTVSSSCSNVSAISAAAATADVNIIVVGDTLPECGEWGDRDSLEMPGSQLQLINLVANATSKGTPVVVVMLHGRPQTFGPGNQALDQIDALLSAWRPGEEGGNAIVNLLTGKTSPSGKLAQSWPQTVGQVGGPAVPWLQRVRGKWVSNHRGCIASEGRCYSPYTNSEYGSTPLFPFGFGMSYTTFSYVSASIKPAADIADMMTSRGALSPHANATVWTVDVTLNNSGTVAATEVVEVYIQDPSGLPVVPFWRRLVGFERVRIAAGTTATIAVPIAWSHLAQYDENMTFKLFSGTYTVFIGGSSDDTPLSYNATLP